ncbi:hypothetical protein [Nonomuraea typhae]|uniref:hypothetical protein n=1 Tax=Nonomuraea typhae TaxID=2603600 RepID=UPI0012FCCD21|nr:hypothetical protein [Nonomuraea typhae]
MGDAESDLHRPDAAPGGHHDGVERRRVVGREAGRRGQVGALPIGRGEPERT